MRNKKTLLVGAIIVALIAGGYFIYSALNQSDKPEYSLQKASEGNKKATTQVDTEESKPETAIDEARSTLESKTKASEKEQEAVSQALQAGLDVLSKSEIGSEVKNDYNSHLQNTSQDLLQITVLMFKAGYKFKDGSLEVYKSDNDNVSQFVFVMSKDGEEDISFAGNYVQGTKQIEIANQHGTPTGLESPDNGPQSE